jgi:hypothetical protein
LAGGINLYSYAIENPINWIDPIGLQESNSLRSYQLLYNGYRPPSVPISVIVKELKEAPGEIWKDFGPDNITTSGIILTEEFVGHWYSSSDGLLPCEASDINFTTALIGGGATAYWDTPLPSWWSNFDITLGPMKNFGLVYNPKTSQVGISLGASLSLPGVNVSIPVDPQAIGPVF